MRSIARIFVLSAVSAGVLAACSSVAPVDSNPAEKRSRAVLVAGGRAATLTLPDTIMAGTALTVSVRSYANDCMTTADTDVSVKSMVARVEPYVRIVHPAGGACSTVFSLIEHQATVRFTTPGHATIEIVGRLMPEERDTTFTRALVVR